MFVDLSKIPVDLRVIASTSGYCTPEFLRHHPFIMLERWTLSVDKLPEDRYCHNERSCSSLEASSLLIERLAPRIPTRHSVSDLRTHYRADFYMFSEPNEKFESSSLGGTGGDSTRPIFRTLCPGDPGASSSLSFHDHSCECGLQLRIQVDYRLNCNFQLRNKPSSFSSVPPNSESSTGRVSSTGTSEYAAATHRESGVSSSSDGIRDGSSRVLESELESIEEIIGYHMPLWLELGLIFSWSGPSWIEDLRYSNIRGHHQVGEPDPPTREPHTSTPTTKSSVGKFPSVRTRAPNAKTRAHHTKESWEEQRPFIEKLYRENNLTMKQVKETMDKRGFVAS
jgi:hypothetical protein